ncbi:14 kDa zinc-binding protein [Phtheirospermum japonicum]|uniref:14 kDa zinc-binding protein n=1 Tax=Phtheirospermum japonicum TaxID=374723 RepID=A0A830D8Y9_9LAMI|nr:14 kDa zinc-binding protein [Phtheirospermum japonicum]
MASEEDAALAAVPSDSPTIFYKILNKKIPTSIVYEDDKVLAFRDIEPQAPAHILLIPKVKDQLTGISNAEVRHCKILGHILYTAKLVAKQEGLDDGFRLVINDGPNGSLIAKGNLIISNAGDCQSVCSRGGVAEALTSDLRPSRQDEQDRIEVLRRSRKYTFQNACFSRRSGRTSLKTILESLTIKNTSAGRS